jgi:hypothetical protein
VHNEKRFCKARSTYAPTNVAGDAALVEGWIHVPSRPFVDLRPDGFTD